MKKELPIGRIRTQLYAKVKKLKKQGYLNAQISRMVDKSETAVADILAGRTPKKK